MDIIATLKRARGIGVPIVAIGTADQPALTGALAEGLNGQAALVRWDLVRGLTPLNDAGAAAVAEVIADRDPEELRNLVITLIAADNMPERSWLVVQNAHKLIDEPAVIQALMNLRDAFKATRRTVVLLAPAFRLPLELSQDVLSIDEPLPAPEAIRACLTELWTDNEIPHTIEVLEQATDALRGLAMFPVEQAASLSTDVKGKSIDLPGLWDRKRAMLPLGLTMETPRDTFSDVGGLAQWKKYQDLYFHGRRRPRVVLWFDEVEKSFAGATGIGDNTGVAQDSHQQLLENMENYGYSGAIAVGPPGSGKSMIARATAATFGVPLLKGDLGALKSRHLGDSEQAARAFWKAVYAIAGDNGAFCIGTCNKLDVLSPELKRRFRAGVWFFDLPDQAERTAIARIQAARFELDPEIATEFFAYCEGWSGANIRDCCEMAYAMDCPIPEAAAFIVPAGVQDPKGIEQLRTLAAGKFLSASQPGTYQLPALKPAPSRRKLEQNL